MELWKEIVCTLLEEGRLKIRVSPKVNLNKLLSNACYLALVKIKKILEDPKNSDESCFEQIEEIVRVFEELGRDCGTRHDIG